MAKIHWHSKTARQPSRRCFRSAAQWSRNCPGAGFRGEHSVFLVAVPSVRAHGHIIADEPPSAREMPYIEEDLLASRFLNTYEKCVFWQQSATS
jgi:hypothetical protein